MNWTEAVIRILCLAFALSSTTGLAKAQATSKGNSGGPNQLSNDASGGGKNGSKSASDTSGGKNGNSAGQPPFETQVLAYGAVDQIALAIAQSTCAHVKSKPAATIIIYDATAFSNIQSYGAFEATLQILRAGYTSIQSAVTGKAPEAGVEDVAALILQYAGASTVENPSSITISDDAVKLNIAHYLMSTTSSCDPAKVTVIYPAVSTKLAAGQKATETISKELQGVGALKAEVGGLLYDPNKPKRDANDPLILRYQDVNKSVDQLLTNLFTKDASSGLMGIVPVLSGYELYQQIHKDGSYILFEEAIAGGGTQRIRKNLFTNVFWGDLIRYSGGAVVAFALIEGSGSSITVANTLRFRTPNETIQAPEKGKAKAASVGDNLDSLQ